MLASPAECGRLGYDVILQAEKSSNIQVKTQKALINNNQPISYSFTNCALY